MAPLLGIAAAAVSTAATAGAFSGTSGMALPRVGHTATLLQDGRVLVTGGLTNTSTGVTNTAEVYDINLRRFSGVGKMSAPRTGAVATLLLDGRVLVTGGYNYPSGFQPSTLATAEVFDPATGSFGPTYGPMSFARVHHAAVLLTDGRVLVTGGDVPGGDDDTAELYDPASSTVLPLPKMLTNRRYHAMFLTADGNVLIVGGTFAEFLPGTELFYVSLQRFQAGPPRTIYTRGDECTVSLLAQQVLIAGGDGDASGITAKSEIFDKSSGRFVVSGQLVRGRRSHACALLPDGRVLLTGGNAFESGNTTTTDSSELFDAGTRTFSPGAQMIVARQGHTATPLTDGTVLIVGGVSNPTGTPLSTVEIYRPEIRRRRAVNH